ncbi:helix-turn-helix transcriptional regulator [Pseudomonas koreensis]|uniref:helix-turn-helix transcriptional regulator n=1 Tax=Pseudomonas koreensis TaxID=198620 RepID=UPI0018E66912|nr:AraC family transcriptional regulator [Pseudomonas koreensis]MBI6945712.1 AraC family transcriptional regulator [Pseudomonas koreensis]
MSNWIDLAHDRETGIETLHAHFAGHAHAYDPHWHETYLIGFTEQGVQRFNSRRARHDSTPGKVFMLEPGDIHDGDAPSPDGFTYRMLYLQPAWLEQALDGLHLGSYGSGLPGIGSVLNDDPELARATLFAFNALHQQDVRMVREVALDALLERLAIHLYRRPQPIAANRAPLIARQARDYLVAFHEQDISLQTLADVCGTDRFRLTRAFKAAYGLAPHAWLIQLRLSRGRQMLAAGIQPVDVASRLGFADQSHLGRWFVRAYGITPGAYQQRAIGASRR